MYAINAVHRPTPRVRAYAQGEAGLCVYDTENERAWIACERAARLADWR